jgi:anhydro-N-acetylmuramic acid kinase
MVTIKQNRVVGLMSGTSLDGLDICLSCFARDKNGFHYTIYAAETVPYSAAWRERLLEAEHAGGDKLMKLNMDYGEYLGQCVKRFLSRIPRDRQPAFVSSHGHTIFHRPREGYTFQLGSGAAIAAAADLPVVCDFRSTDIGLGGQGAPLVPVGDMLLFSEYDYCLNLGGFANISFERGDKRIAYDICPVNYVMNRLAQREGRFYDEDGKMAEKGRVLKGLLEDLDDLQFYHDPHPKSVGREWVEDAIFPLLPEDTRTNDLLRTFTEHVVHQIALSTGPRGKMLVTGGGTHNSFLMKLLRKSCSIDIVVPDQMTIDFKEALIFAFLGWLRWHKRVNALSSVTGARKDSSTGAIYLS